jgi:hypothetical protein
MIIVELLGGLGNQMFQYALGRRLSIYHNTELRLDTSAFQFYKLRNYELGCFNINGKLMEYRKAPFLNSNRIVRKIIRKYQNITNNITMLHEKGFNFNTDLLAAPDNVYLVGYWQSEKYFKDIEETIRAEFTMKAPLIGYNLEIANQIRDCENSVALHIRRGDYVSNPATNQHHGICDIEYYHKSVRILSDKLGKLDFFVFSDDSDWAIKNLKLNYPMTFLNHNCQDKAYEDMRLMSLCKHNIIANSSFSWWGAWLNSNSNKIVIAPERWFKKKGLDTTDLIPNSWLRV